MYTAADRFIAGQLSGQKTYSVAEFAFCKPLPYKTLPLPKQTKHSVCIFRLPLLRGNCAYSFELALCAAKQALPVVGLSGLEPPTSRLSGVRSNRLSYKPMCSG